MVIHLFNVHFSLFFADDLLLFIFILDCRKDARQKSRLERFSYEFKIGHKAVETTRNIRMHLAQELLMSM